MSDSARAEPAPVLLGGIYSAAVEDSEWDDVLDQCIEFVGARSGALVSLDSLDPDAYSLSRLGKVLREQLSPALNAEWMEQHAPQDALGHRRLLNWPARRIVTDLEAFDCTLEALALRPDSRFLIDHFGLDRKMVARLNDTPRYYESLAFQFSSDLTDIPVAAPGRMSMLLPHVAKAVELGQLFGRLRQRFAAALSALEYLGLGICVLDPQRRLIVANDEARRILDAGHGLGLDAELRLRCRDSANQTKLAAACTAATLERSMTATRAESLLTLRRHPDAEPVLVEISPLRDTLQELHGENGAIFVHLIDLASAANIDTGAFAKVYDLTSAEKAVAELLVAGLGNQDIADARETTVDTIKMHVSRLMDKTGTRSRVLLVRAILKADPPIAPVQSP